MTDIAARIAHYREEVRHAADLEAASAVFHDRLACNREFLALGKVHKDRRLSDIVVASLSRAFRGEVALTETRLLRLDGARFVHGSGVAALERDGRQETLLVIVTYFEEDDIGLCVALDLDMRAMFLRFSAHQLNGPAVVSARGSA